MDVNNLKPTDRVTIPVSNTAANGQPVEVKAEVQPVLPERNSVLPEDQKKYTNEELLPITKELNKFMTYLNADIQFSLHEKTKQLMVKVVDIKEQKVLREFPPEDFLDMVANIREYIGILLDKKA